jgi:hypothetical protein
MLGIMQELAFCFVNSITPESADGSIDPKKRP